jgi:RHS repeat-associated protein
MNPFYKRSISAVAAVGLFITPAVGDVGSNNPTGTSGEFNGEVTTGGSYDPYTGNVTRSITDLVVAGAVGYPLAFTRTTTSRYVAGLTTGFGAAGSWRHSYQWSIDPVTFTSRFANWTPPLPSSYTVNYPDGRRVVFSSRSGDIYFRGPTGVRDRFEQIPTGTTTFPAFCYLHLPDGGKVKFGVSIDSYDTGPDGQETWFYTYRYTLISIIDPYGRAQTVSYPADGSMTITEPAGRTLKVFFINTNWSGGPYERVISYILTSDGRRVNYGYSLYQSSNGTHYTSLTSVSYFPGTADAISASYTYRNDNVTVNGRPLIWTCNDPMYPGPITQIRYVYASGTNPDGTAVAYGQIKSEYYGSQAVSTLTVNNGATRTETRGDLKTRTFTYSTNGFLTRMTDFKALAASQTYDTSGYVNAVTDRNAHATNFTRNTLTGALTQIQYPLTSSDTPGQTARPTAVYTYGWANCPDPNNRDPYNPYYLYSIRDEGGHVTTFTRDTLKRVTRIDYPDGGYETFSYNGFGQVTSHRMTTGGTETFGYDSTQGYVLVWHRDPYHASGAASASYQYETHDWVSGMTDAAGNTTNFAYNLRGQLTQTTHPTDPNDGVRHTFKNYYNPDGTLNYTVNEISQVNDYSYDAYKRLRSVTTPLRLAGDTTPRTTYFYYDASGSGEDYRCTDASVTYAVLPSGKKTKTTYDENRRKISVTAALGTTEAAITSYDYDNVGNLTSIVAPNEQEVQQYPGKSTTTAYDERNRPKWVTDALNNRTILEYDLSGRKYRVTRPNGQTITYNSYDEMNRLLQQVVTQTPEPNAITKYTYTPAGLLATMQDPRLVATGSDATYSYTYDLMGRKVWVNYPPDSGGVSRVEQFVFDDVGRLATFRTRAGKVQTFTYDALNRMTGFSWNDNGVTPSVTFGYDAASRLTSANNANATISRAYFNDNLLKSETERIIGGPAPALTISYTYDADGNRASDTWPYNVGHTYTYTGRNQLKTIVEEGFTLATYAYNVNGDLTSRTAGNSTTSTFAYDALDRVTNITHALVGTTRTFGYGYDSVGNRNWIKRDGGNGDVFDYDLADQATVAKLNIANPSGTTPGAPTITYDANGNRTSFAAYGTTENYVTNDLNQYTQRNATAAAYDFNGNMITGLDSSSYTYDAQNRLTSVYKNPTTETFKYDALNRQVSRTINGVVTYNIWDGWNLIVNYNSANVWTNAYYDGPGGRLADMGHYYYAEGSGSTSHLADSTGHLLEWYRYDLHGTPIIYNASDAQISASAYGIRHLFTGQQWYSEIGLYDLRNRFYSPDIGRFLQPDPIGFGGDATNLYRYCGNNPIGTADPLGLWTFQIGGSYTGQVGPFTLSVSGGIAFDRHGNVGVFSTGLIAPGFGANSSGGVIFGWSPDASAVNDLRGPFWNVGGEVSPGGSVSFDGFSNKEGTVTGSTVTLGLGAGGGVYAGGSRTWVSPTINVFDMFSSLNLNGGPNQPTTSAPPAGGSPAVDPNICPECATVEPVVVTGQPVEHNGFGGFVFGSAAGSPAGGPYGVDSWGNPLRSPAGDYNHDLGPIPPSWNGGTQGISAAGEDLGQLTGWAWAMAHLGGASSQPRMPGIYR